MELCLYDPIAGYYSRNSEQFGKAGDFYTSSDVHAVFGRLLARQFDEIWRALDRPAQIEILELGPGRGLFARDMLDWSKKKFPEFFDALPVEILSPRGKLHLALDNNRLREIWLPALPEELEFLDRYGVHPEGDERIEVPLLAQNSIRHVARSIERGL